MPFFSIKKVPLFGSVLSVFYLLALYFIDPSLYANFYLRILVFFFILAFMVYSSVFTVYDINTSVRPFLKPPFLTFAIIAFWVQLTHVFIFNYVHPRQYGPEEPLSSLFRKADYDFQFRRLEAGGAPPIEFKKMKAEIESRQYGIDFSGAMKQYVYMLFPAFAIAMILALLMQYRRLKENV